MTHALLILSATSGTFYLDAHKYLSELTNWLTTKRLGVEKFVRIENLVFPGLRKQQGQAYKSRSE